jgi:hypothetical protein
MEYQINTEQGAVIIDNGKIIATIKRVDNKDHSGYAVYERDIGNYPVMVGAVYDSFDSAFNYYTRDLMKNSNIKINENFVIINLER